MPPLVVEGLGIRGVNVDKNPLELDDSELLKAQNAISVTQNGKSTLTKRPGLIAFNTSAAAGSVLGGMDLPLPDLSSAGTRYIYLGRGPV